MWHLPFFSCHKCKMYTTQIKELKKNNKVILENNLNLHSRCLLLEEHIRLTEKNEHSIMNSNWKRNN